MFKNNKYDKKVHNSESLKQSSIIGIPKFYNIHPCQCILNSICVHKKSLITYLNVFCLLVILTQKVYKYISVYNSHFHICAILKLLLCTIS